MCRESSANTEVRASTYQDPRLVFRMAAVPGERDHHEDFWGTQTHKSSLCPNNQGPVPFRQAYPQIISEHVGRRSFRLSSLFASLSSQPGESDHPLPSLWSTPRSNSSVVAINKERERGRRNYPELLDVAFLYFLSLGLWTATPQLPSCKKFLH